VLRRVLAGRLIAAADVPARRAQAQMNPLAACGETLGATIRGSWRNVADL